MALRSCSLSCVSVRSLYPFDASLIVLMQSACEGLFFLWLILGLSLVRSTTTMSSTVMRRELLISALISSSFIGNRKYCQEDQCHPFIRFHNITKARVCLFQAYQIERVELYRNALNWYVDGSGQTKTMNPVKEQWQCVGKPRIQTFFESHRQSHDSTQSYSSLTKGQLRSIIKQVVDREVAHLMDRINYLQDQLKSQSESKKKRRSRHSSNDSNESDYTEQKQTNYQSTTPSDTRKRRSEQCFAYQPKKELDVQMKSILTEQVNLRIEKLQRLATQPMMKEAWNIRVAKIKKILLERAFRNTRFTKISEKREIVSFIHYGDSLGLNKLLLIFLVGISRSSFDLWKKEVK